MTILNEAIERYFAARSYKRPDAQEAMLFAVSEVGEAADVLLEMQGGWVRNNPDAKSGKVVGFGEEVGDALMMLASAWLAVSGNGGKDPIVFLLEKMHEKTGDAWFLRARTLYSELRIVEGGASTEER